MSVSTGNIITRVYSNFRGADFRGEEINLVRSPDCLNVWKDYKFTESIRTRPGMKRLEAFDHPDTIYGIYFYNSEMLVHSGSCLWKVANGQTSLLCMGINNTYERGNGAFIYDNVWYFKDGYTYLQYDGTTIKEVEGYVPTTSIARKMVNDDSGAGGTIYDPINLLSDYRINTFVGDGTNVYAYLDAQNIDEVVEVVVNDEPLASTLYSVDLAKGRIAFHGSVDVPAPETDGQANISIKFKKTVEGYRERILKCSFLQVFDNRVFFSGNKDYPNTVWHCRLNDPTYCSDLDYYEEGVDFAQINGMVAGNNALWVFREPSASNTNVFYHMPTIDSDYGKIYPSSHSNISLGCIGKAINFNDDIVFFSERGMEGINGDITTEQFAAHRSSLVDRKLISGADYKNMLLEEWNGYLLVFIGNKVFLADSRTAFTVEDHIEYEWFYWELEKAITCAKVFDNVLYLGTDDGVYTMSAQTTEDGVYTETTDPTSNIESYWVTPKDKFKTPHKLKTTNKRGCVVEAEGDISVYAKTDDTDFEHIGTYENITDYFVSRIKRKKFKDIQLKFHSNTSFSLETATLECFIGGYIKR